MTKNSSRRSLPMKFTNILILWFKRLLKDALKKLEKTLLYSKQTVYLSQTTIVRRIHDGTGFTTTGLKATQVATAKINNAKDLNIDKRIIKFKDQLKDKYAYRIPLKCVTDLAKINFPLKMDFRIKCHPEKEMKRLFESK